MSRILRDFAKFVAVVRKSGLGHACKVVGHALRTRFMRKSDKRWEAKFGVTTREDSELDSLDVSSENKKYGFSYVPSPERSVRVLLGNLPDDLSHFSFIDFGSGEGRVLLVAAAFPFREIIGVEFAKELQATAVENVAKVARSPEEHARFRCLHLDATQFDVPRQPCVLYFFNPFGEQVFEQVLKNIERAHRESGKKMYVLYQQVAGDLEESRTSNIHVLRGATFLLERKVRFPSLWDRFLLGSHESFIFETREP